MTGTNHLRLVSDPERASEIADMLAFFRLAAPRLRQAYASRPRHAIWEAIRSAEAIAAGRLDRLHTVPKGIEAQRAIARLLHRRFAEMMPA